MSKKTLSDNLGENGVNNMCFLHHMMSLSLFVFALCVLFGALPYIFKHCFDGELLCFVPFFRVMSPGDYGDYFGVLNTFFAGLAFVGIILSIRLQNKSILLQASEINAMHRDIEDQAVWQHEARVRETFQYCLNLLESKQNSLYFVMSDKNQSREFEGPSVLVHAGNYMENVWDQLNAFFDVIKSGKPVSAEEEIMLLINIECAFNMFGACQAWFRTLLVVRNELKMACKDREFKEKMNEIFSTLTRHQRIILSVYEDVDGPINKSYLVFDEEYTKYYPDKIVHVIKCLNHSLRPSGCCRGTEGRKVIIHNFLHGIHHSTGEGSTADSGGHPAGDEH